MNHRLHLALRRPLGGAAPTPAMALTLLRASQGGEHGCPKIASSDFRKPLETKHLTPDRAIISWVTKCRT